MTGGTGYLGTRLLHSLVENGFKIALLKRRSSVVDVLRNLENLEMFDVEDDLSKLLNEWGSPEIVIHAATCYGRSGEDEREILESNFLYPKKILNLCKNSNVKYFFNCDTSLPLDVSSYAKYKKLFASYARDCAMFKKIKIINMQLEYFYGPNEVETKLSGFIIKACLRGDEKISMSPGDQIRDFIHIDDVVSAFGAVIQNIESLEDDVFYREFQVGTGNGCSIKKFATTIKKLTNSGTKLNFGEVPYRANEVMCSIANNQSLIDIGWNPRYQIESGLKHVIDREKKYFNDR